MGECHETESKAPMSGNILLGYLFNNRGTILGVIGIILAIYFYQAAKTTPDLVYVVNPAKAVIIRAKSISRLQITLGQETVNRDVTAAQIAIWNNGEESIRGENLLSPFIIETGPRNPIIEASIQKVTREVVGLHLDEAKIDEGQIGVDWTILEQHDGAVLQLIYFGSSHTRITVSAVVEKQGKARSLENDREKNSWRIWVGVMALGLSGLMLSVIRLSGLDRPFYSYVGLVLILLQFLGLLFLLVFNWALPSLSPPFGWESSP